MKLTENTKVKIRVPKHLYEAIQAELDKKEMEESDEYMEENLDEVLPGYVGMSPAEAQAMQLAGEVLAALAAGTGLTAGIVNLAKKVKSKIQSKSDKPEQAPEVAPEELEEVFDLNTLMEAVKDASKKKAEEKKKKELEAKKKKAEDEKKKKEAEAKKKAAAAKKK